VLASQDVLRNARSAGQLRPCHYDVEEVPGDEMSRWDQEVWSTMAENCGLLHVRAISTLPASCRVRDQYYFTRILPLIARDGSLDEVGKIVKDLSASERTFPPVLAEGMRLRDHIMVSTKEHNLFYPPPGTPFDAVSMDAMQSNASLTVPPDDTHQYRVILCLWHDLMNSVEYVLPFVGPYRYDSEDKDRLHWMAAMIDGNDWEQDVYELRKEPGPKLVERAVVLVKKIEE
jgi:hypothetical protein